LESTAITSVRNETGLGASAANVAPAKLRKIATDTNKRTQASVMGRRGGD